MSLRSVHPTLLTVMTMVVLAGALFAGVSHLMATLDGDVEVINSTCIDDETGAVTAKITYNGTAPVTVTPHTWDEHRHVQYAWIPENVTLKPGTQTVRLWAPVEQARITPNSTAQLYLNHGQQRLITNWRSNRC